MAIMAAESKTCIHFSLTSTDFHIFQNDSSNFSHYQKKIQR